MPTPAWTAVPSTDPNGPISWTLSSMAVPLTPSVKLVLTQKTPGMGSAFLLSSAELGIRNALLQSTTLDAAKVDAISYAKAYLQKLSAALDALTGAS